MAEQSVSTRLRIKNPEGWTSALLAPLFLGLAPILGKIAYMGGSDPFTVVAIRSVVAIAILWAIYLLFWRRYIYIYPTGLVGCIILGILEGVGSLLYFNGLYHLDASVAQLLNATYLIFMVVLTRFRSRRLRVRLIACGFLALVAVSFLVAGLTDELSWLGEALILANAVLFAGAFILSQRVLYEMPAPTLTLYVLTTMAVVVVFARGIDPVATVPSSEALLASVILGILSAFAWLTLFMGVKALGRLQTIIFGILEILVTLVAAFFFLQERLLVIQVIGGVILVLALIFIRPKAGNVEIQETQEMPQVEQPGQAIS